MARYFVIPPVCQGQIVEVAYLQVGDLLLRRVTDRSDRSVDYAVCELEDEECDGIDPANVEPSPRGGWSPITATRAAFIQGGH